MQQIKQFTTLKNFDRSYRNENNSYNISKVINEWIQENPTYKIIDIVYIPFTETYNLGGAAVTKNNVLTAMVRYEDSVSVPYKNKKTPHTATNVVEEADDPLSDLF